jgi:hypothetical protein
MSKKTWVKWGFVLAGSTLAALNLGACLADFILQNTILAWVG